jgi:hypothetical protein
MSEGTIDDTGARGLEDMLASEDPLIENEENLPIADAPLPGYGTE